MELTVPELTSLLPQPVRQPSFFKTRLPTHIYGPETQPGKVNSPLIKRLEGRFLGSSDEGLSYEEFTQQLKLYEQISKPVPREKSKVEIISEWKRERIKSGAVKVTIIISFPTPKQNKKNNLQKNIHNIHSITFYTSYMHVCLCYCTCRVD